MKTSLDYLPEGKQAHILKIMEIIREVVNPEMIILFGSYAKNTYVEHRYRSNGIQYEYISDYDFFVVTKENQGKASDQESLIMNKTERYKQPVNLEIHDIEYVNKGLELGEYFFVDIVKEGVLLFDKKTVKFAEPRELTSEEKKEKALRYFNTWYPQSEQFIFDTENSIGRGTLRNPTFFLHQSTESLYYALLLVFTDYKPKTHNLWKLRRKSKLYSKELFNVFQAETDKAEKQLFELLKQGYIDARYREDFEITIDELKILLDRVKLMNRIVETICKEKIELIK